MNSPDYEKFPEDVLELASGLIDELNFSPKELAVLEAEIAAGQDEHVYQTLELLYLGEPKAQARARHSRLTNHFFDPSQSLKAWLVEQIQTQLPKNFKPLQDSIEMHCVFYKAPPKSTSKKAKVLMELGIVKCSTKPDLDNYVKLVQDALNQVLYMDDSQITVLSAEKYYSCKPRAKITLRFKRLPGVTEG
jgi:Holliday junction resolvase RusA-like endonuclease